MRIYSVTEYREELNELLSQVTVAIEAEISSYHVSQNRFVWFTLADDQCVIDCFMLLFEQKVPLEEGMRVRVVGSPNMFKKGKVVFRPRQVELIGEGDLQKAFQLLKVQLEKEGLFDDARKRSLPKMPQHIAVVTSRDAAAYTDVLRVIENRWPFVRITLMHVQVQGQGAANSIVAGLHEVYDFHKNTKEENPIDAILLTRGGGSMEDLQAFNTEEVVRAVYASPVPVVSAVGHERDTTLVDFVADVRAATPSNAAEILVPHKDDVLQSVQYTAQRAQGIVRARYTDIMHGFAQAVHAMKYAMYEPMNRYRQLVAALREQMQARVHALRMHAQKVDAMTTLLETLHPERLLQRGYAIVRGENGNTIHSISQLNPKDSVHIQFADGIAESEIQRIISTNTTFYESKSPKKTSKSKE